MLDAGHPTVGESSTSGAEERNIGRASVHRGTHPHSKELRRMKNVTVAAVSLALAVRPPRRQGAVAEGPGAARREQRKAGRKKSERCAGGQKATGQERKAEVKAANAAKQAEVKAAVAKQGEVKPASTKMQAPTPRPRPRARPRPRRRRPRTARTRAPSPRRHARTPARRPSRPASRRRRRPPRPARPRRSRLRRARPRRSRRRPRQRRRRPAFPPGEVRGAQADRGRGASGGGQGGCARPSPRRPRRRRIRSARMQSRRQRRRSRTPRPRRISPSPTRPPRPSAPPPRTRPTRPRSSGPSNGAEARRPSVRLRRGGSPSASGSSRGTPPVRGGAGRAPHEHVQAASPVRAPRAHAAGGPVRAGPRDLACPEGPPPSMRPART